MRLAFWAPRKQVFSRRGQCCLLDSSRTNVTSPTDNNIKNKYNDEAVIRYINGLTLFDCALHRLIHKSFVTMAHRAGYGGNFDFLATGPWYDPVLTAHLPGWVWLQMTGAHNFFCLYALITCGHTPAKRNVEDFDFVFAVPQSNHHTVGTASWQNHDISSPHSVIILHCHVCLGLSNPYISSALLRQCKSKNIAHLPGYGYPCPAQGLG